MQKVVSGMTEKWMLIVLLGVSLTGAASTDSLLNKVPWDSVVAEIQIVQGSRLPDSIKAQLLEQVFKKFNIEMADYQAFYLQFRTWSNKQVVRFLHRVETILKAWSKQPNRVFEKRMLRPKHRPLGQP